MTGRVRVARRCRSGTGRVDGSGCPLSPIRRPFTGPPAALGLAEIIAFNRDSIEVPRAAGATRRPSDGESIAMSTPAGARFRKSMELQWAIRFKTRRPDGDNYDGIVVYRGRGFVVLREVRDLVFDGLVLLKTRAVRGFRDGKFEHCLNEILRQSGAMKELRAPAWLAGCPTIQDVLENLRRRAVWPAIEAVFEDGDSALYLGRIEGVYVEGVRMYCYDAAGEWEDYYRLTMDQIFRIAFDSQYCHVFDRYMRSRGDGAALPA